MYVRNYLTWESGQVRPFSYMWRISHYLAVIVIDAFLSLYIHVHVWKIEGLPLLTHMIVNLQLCSLTGNHTIGRLLEESKIWVGERMVVCGCLYVVGVYILAKEQG